MRRRRPRAGRDPRQRRNPVDQTPLIPAKAGIQKLTTRWVPDERICTDQLYTFTGCVGGGGVTPSFFCKLVDDVVYWNTSRLSG